MSYLRGKAQVSDIFELDYIFFFRDMKFLIPTTITGHIVDDYKELRFSFLFKSL